MKTSDNFNERVAEGGGMEDIGATDEEVQEIEGYAKVRSEGWALMIHKLLARLRKVEGELREAKERIETLELGTRGFP